MNSDERKTLAIILRPNTAFLLATVLFSIFYAVDGQPDFVMMGAITGVFFPILAITLGLFFGNRLQYAAALIVNLFVQIIIFSVLLMMGFADNPAKISYLGAIIMVNAMGGLFGISILVLYGLASALRGALSRFTKKSE